MSIESIRSYLGGEWKVGNGPGTPLLDPSTEEVLAMADTSGLDFESALTTARRTGGPALAALSFTERAELLAKMSTALHAAREPLIDSAVRNGGCTRADAKFDVDGAIGTLSAYAELGKTLGDRRILADGEGVVLGRNPRWWGQHVYTSRAGVAVLINAFNFPAWGFAEKAACALLAGMPIVTKPATATALTAYRLTEVLVQAAILPPGAMSFIAGSAGDLLDHLDGQDVLAFTGSAVTGRMLRQRPRLLERGVPVNVEADSLNAAVLGPDVELGSDGMALFLQDVARDMTQKTGQKCTAIRRILLPEAIAADVEAELAARLAEVKVGNPALAEVRMGPLASASQRDDVRAGVALLGEDAEVVYRSAEGPWAGAPEGKGFFHPIVLLRARDAASAPRVHSHEVFGPVATVLRYSGQAEEAVELVRRGEGGLVASVYSDDRRFLETAVLGIAPFHGRIYVGGAKVRDLAPGPGLVLPSCVHGGPGRAGAGEELGGVRGVMHYMQRTAIQGYRPVVEALTGTKVG